MTHVRIKLDFVVQCPRSDIPWFQNVNALVINGLARTIPTATHVLPGGTAVIEDIGLRAQVADERRKAKADGKAKRLRTSRPRLPKATAKERV